MKKLIDVQTVENRIFYIRGQRVMLDADLAELYGVATKNLNKAVNRNRIRFPSDFMFQLTDAELENLRFQIGTSRWGGRRYLPYAFTEQGVAMLSSVLRSERAALVNIAIMRAFVRMREILAAHKDLLHRIEDIEEQMAKQGVTVEEHTREIRAVFEAIQALIRAGEPRDQNVLKSSGFQRK